MLLGWAAADRDKAVFKYAELLAQSGYASVRSVQPLFTAFSPFGLTRRRWALALLRYLEERQLWPQRRLVLFAFSNGEGQSVAAGMMWHCRSKQTFLHSSLGPPAALCHTGGLYVVEQLMLIAESDPR